MLEIFFNKPYTFLGGFQMLLIYMDNYTPPMKIIFLCVGEGKYPDYKREF